MPKILKKFVDGLPPATDKPAFYFDDEVKGFGVRVSGSTKTYIVQGYVGGKKVRVKLGRHGQGMTAEEARKQAKSKVGEWANGSHPQEQKRPSDATEVTLGKVFEEYIDARKADGGLSPKTISVYRSAIDRCFGDWKDKPACQITSTMVNDRWEQLATTEGPRSKKGGARAQASQAIRVLKTLMTFASVKYEDDNGKSVIDSAPTRKLKAMHRKWSQTAARDDMIRVDQMADWYKGVIDLPNDTMRDYLLLCFFTGLRRSAAAKIKWSDIDLKAKVLTIPAENDKNKKERHLPLPDYLVEMFEVRRTNHPRRIGNDYVFARDDDRSAARVRGRGQSTKSAEPYIQEPKAAIARVIKKSGVKFSMHTFRRTFKTVADQHVGISPYTWKALTHSSVGDDVDGKHYVQVELEQLREPMQRICDFLREKCGASGTTFRSQIPKAQ